MNLDVFLLLLRAISGLLLVALLVILSLLVWRDYRRTVDQLHVSRRTFGQLVALEMIDEQYFALDEKHPLLPMTSIGRSPTNSVVIEDSFASGDHARITLRDGQWWLEDRQSRNGTALNDMPVTQPTILTDGDVIGIGRRRFRIDLENNRQNA